MGEYICDYDQAGQSDALSARAEGNIGDKRGLNGYYTMQCLD